MKISLKYSKKNLTVVGLPAEYSTPKNKPMMSSPTISMVTDIKTEDFQIPNNPRYLANNGIYDEKVLMGSDSNSQIISLSMYGMNPGNQNKQMIPPFQDKNIKIENTANLGEKREDEYENDEGELFPELTKDKIIELKRFEQEIKTKSDEEKINIAINSLKIKRHSISLYCFLLFISELNQIFG